MAPPDPPKVGHFSSLAGNRARDVAVTSRPPYPLGYKRESAEFAELCAKIGALRDSSRGCGGDKSTVLNH